MEGSLTEHIVVSLNVVLNYVAISVDSNKIVTEAKHNAV